MNPSNRPITRKMIHRTKASRNRSQNRFIGG